MDPRSRTPSFDVEGRLDRLAEKIAALPEDRAAALQDFLRHEWLTVDEVAAALRVHPETVRRWIKSGRLPAYRTGSRSPFRIRQDELERFLANEPR